MALIIADSDVLIDALRGRADAVEFVRTGIINGTLATTAISAFELQSGAGSDHGRQAVAELLAPLDIVPFDAVAADAAASVRRMLDATGLPIGMADCQIAGICLSRNAMLATRNVAHFERVPGLRLRG